MAAINRPRLMSFALLRPHGRFRTHLPFICLLLVGLFLRLHRLTAQSFWNDEGNSVRLSERSIRLIIEGTASDIHPPLYYLLLHGWQQLLGQSMFSLRLLSVLLGVLTIAAVVALGRALGEKRPWLLALAALLTAVNPALVYYSQEARMYALLGLLATLATVCLLRWLGVVPGSRPSRRWWLVAYVLLAAAGLYTHYFFPALLVAHNLLFLLWTGRRLSQQLGRWMGVMTAVLLLYLPWLPIFVQQFGADDFGDRGGFGTFWATAVSRMMFGLTLPNVPTLGWALGVGLLFVMGLVYGRRRFGFVLLCWLLPLLFMYGTGTVQEAYFKFLLLAIPFLCWLLATAVGLVPTKWGQLLVMLLLIGPLVWGNGRSLHNLYTDPAYARADYRAMAARIMAEAHPNAGIILNAANQWEVFTYYYPDETAVYPLPEGRSQPQAADIDHQLRQITARHDRLYVLFWGEAQRDPERLIERWLDEHTFKATDEWVGDVRFVTYAVPQQPATQMETAVALPFGSAITLEGYTVANQQLQAGDILQVTLFWQTAVPIAERYKLFLHLVGPDGSLVAQRDSEPGGGLNLTTIWPVGETIVDNHGVLLPPTLADGRYTLLVGLYNLADPNQRLPIQTETSSVDAWPLATFTYQRP